MLRSSDILSLEIWSTKKAYLQHFKFLTIGTGLPSGPPEFLPDWPPRLQPLHNPFYGDTPTECVTPHWVVSGRVRKWVQRLVHMHAGTRQGRAGEGRKLRGSGYLQQKPLGFRTSLPIP